MKRMLVLSGIFAFASVTYAQDYTVTASVWSSVNWGLVFAVFGAAFATFGGGYGSSVGVGLAGEVGSAVLTEDAKKFGSVLLLQALPMTQGIYGLVYGLLIVFTPDLADISLTQGLQFFFASLPVGISGLISGIWQGRVSAAGMQLIARRPKQLAQAMLLPAMVETFAIFGFLVSFLSMRAGQ